MFCNGLCFNDTKVLDEDAPDVIVDRINQLLEVIRPECVALVDGFGFSDHELKSTLGKPESRNTSRNFTLSPGDVVPSSKRFTSLCVRSNDTNTLTKLDHYVLNAANLFFLRSKCNVTRRECKILTSVKAFQGSSTGTCTRRSTGRPS